MQSYKVLLIGDGGVGKTSFMNRHRLNMFEKRYIPTLGVEVRPLQFRTNYGDMIIKFWDTAGQEKFSGLREGYYHQAHGVIFMADSTSKLTFKNLPGWIHSVNKVCGNIPSVMCITKCDIKEQEIVKENYPQACLISSKESVNINEPIIRLLRDMTGHKDLNIVGESKY